MVERQIKCPFFGKRKSACVHSCEGWRDNMTVSMSFVNGAADRAYAADYCYRGFWRCPLYRIIMAERFPDCANYYDGAVFYHGESSAEEDPAE